MTKLELELDLWINPNCEKTQNSNCDKTLKLKLWEEEKIIFWQNSKTQILAKIRNSDCYKTQKLKLWQNLKTQIATKPKNWNSNKLKTQAVIKIKTQIVKKNLNSNCERKKLKKSKFWQHSGSNNT